MTQAGRQFSANSKYCFLLVYKPVCEPTDLFPRACVTTWRVNSGWEALLQHVHPGAQSPTLATPSNLLSNPLLNAVLFRRGSTLGYTTNPSEMFCNVFSTVSAVRNASAKQIRLENKQPIQLSLKTNNDFREMQGVSQGAALLTSHARCAFGIPSTASIS